MSTIIGAECLIGNAFIALGKEQNLYFSDLKEYGFHVKEYCDKNSIDIVLFLSTNNFEKAVYDFSDYFECGFDSEKNDRFISLKDSIEKSRLEECFLSALPMEVLIALINGARCLAA